MSNYSQQESQIFLDIMHFAWKIKNFSVDNLPEGRKSIKSPLFQCFSISFYFKMSRDSDNIYLRLVQDCSDGSSWIIQTRAWFYYADGAKYKFEINTMERERNQSMISFEERYPIPIDDIKRHTVADCKLTVVCQLKAATLRHDIAAQSLASTTGAKESSSASPRPSTLAENIGSFFANPRFSDVKLKVGEEVLPAHKVILASRSKVFDAMFRSSMKESREGVVEMGEVKLSTAKEMLRYMYAGEIEELSMDRAVDLYVAADRYDLQELRGRCKEFILQHISAKDVCKIAVLADLHSDEKLVIAVKRVFKEKSKSILASEEWKNFAKKNPTVYASLVESALK